MRDYLNLLLTQREIAAVSNLGLAHIGDCVFELMVRSWLVSGGTTTNRRLHAETVEHVRASAQAEGVRRLLPVLTEEETAVYRRGRNAHVHSVPKGADVETYHAATGLECLFGWLYLQGRHERLNALFAQVIGAETEGAP